MVGPQWLELHDGQQPFGEHDEFAKEIRRLLELEKRVFVVRTGNSPDIDRWKLPKDMQRLTAVQTLVVTDASWRTAFDQLAAALQDYLQPRSTISERP